MVVHPATSNTCDLRVKALCVFCLNPKKMLSYHAFGTGAGWSRYISYVIVISINKQTITKLYVYIKLYMYIKI